jgi:hypothetical protein
VLSLVEEREGIDIKLLEYKVGERNGLRKSEANRGEVCLNGSSQVFSVGIL